MNTPTQSFADLTSVLQQETEIYGQLAQLLESEREALLHLATSDLAEICSAKQTLGLRVKALDESRKVIAGRMGRHFGIAGGDLTVSALVRVAPAELAGALESARLGLRESASHCKQLNDYNARAARRGHDLISGAIDHLIAGPDPAGKVYQNKGGYGGAARRSTPTLVSRQA